MLVAETIYFQSNLQAYMYFHAPCELYLHCFTSKQIFFSITKLMVPCGPHVSLCLFVTLKTYSCVYLTLLPTLCPHLKRNTSSGFLSVPLYLSCCFSSVLSTELRSSGSQTPVFFQTLCQAHKQINCQLFTPAVIKLSSQQQHFLESSTYIKGV